MKRHRKKLAPEAEAVLNAFRAAGACEWCGAPCARREPHHVFCKGMGGTRRLDVRLNLVGLCARCHADFHDGRILRCDLLAVVAAREGCLQSDIERAVYAARKPDGFPDATNHLAPTSDREGADAFVL